MTIGHLLAGVFVLAGVMAVTAAIVINPPSEVRKHTIDGVRIQDLQGINNAVDTYASTHHQLPTTLDNLLGGNTLRDPETNGAYGYEITGKSTYKLCAVFSAETGPQQSCCSVWGQQWAHKAGPQCFEKSPPSMAIKP